MSITVRVNGKAVAVRNIEPTTTTLEWLRQTGRTGTKEGCAEGDCGACTIAIRAPDRSGGSQWRSVCACILPVAQLADHDIVTVEGLADGDHLHPLQQTFLEGAALQCGICTPGFLVAAKALLDENPDPTETEIRYGLAGNLCRCTGYDKIVRAVQEAAVQLQTSKQGA